MRLTPEFDYKKATQSLNFLAEKEGGVINYMKAIKLLYLAERFHLRMYGRPITNDKYWAMENGPVASTSLNIAKADEDNLDKVEINYSEKYLDRNLKLKTIKSKSKPDRDVFSESDLEALEFSYENFGKKDQWALRDLSHEYPEWKKFEKDFGSFTRRVEMNFFDFFEDPEKFNITKFGDDKFSENPEQKIVAKSIFEQTMKIAGILQ